MSSQGRLLLIYLSPTVQIDLLKNAEAIFPLKNPGLVTIPLAFIVGIVVSLAKSDRYANEKFDEVERLIHSAGEVESPALALED